MVVRLLVVAVVLFGVDFESDRVWDHRYIFKGTWLIVYSDHDSIII